MRVFHDLSNKEQDDIRRIYRDNCNMEYRYSINLFIIYVILGICSILGLIVLFFVDLLVGSVIFTMSLILLGIDLYFLYLSNNNFYRFLKKKGFIYKK